MYNLKQRFFIETKMETKGRNFGYLHLESVIYQAYDKNETLQGDFLMIDDGCSVNKLIQFKGISDHEYHIGVW